MDSVTRPLTVDVQVGELANFVIDSDIREVGQGRVRATGGGFLVKDTQKKLPLRQTQH